MNENKQANTVAEWIREREATARFGMSHMILFNLRKAGKIRTVSLRAEGKNHGARLFNVESIRSYLEEQEAFDNQREAAAGQAK